MKWVGWIKCIIFLLPIGGLTACGESVSHPQMVNEWPEIYPDYIGVTIPAGIAPMNFDVIAEGVYERVDVQVEGSNGRVLVFMGHAVLYGGSGDYCKMLSQTLLAVWICGIYSIGANQSLPLGDFIGVSVLCCRFFVS